MGCSKDVCELVVQVDRETLTTEALELLPIGSRGLHTTPSSGRRSSPCRRKTRYTQLLLYKCLVCVNISANVYRVACVVCCGLQVFSMVIWQCFISVCLVFANAGYCVTHKLGTSVRCLCTH